MKANGRRRWRRRARKWRHKEREYGTYVLRFPPGYRNNLGGYDRRHQHSAAGRYSADGKERKLAADTPPRPFSARSLPGMSQGARKRMALRARQAALSLIAGAGREADPKKLALLRSIYRIGERLRPCPGCNQCGPTIEVERMVCKSCDSDNIGYNTNPDDLPTIGVCAMGAELTGEPGSEQCNQCDGFDIQTEGTMLTKLHTFSICDGSGILPTTIGR